MLTAAQHACPTRSDLAAAERRIRAEFLDRWGCEPGVLWVRERALELMEKENCK
jgi:hypothetical protein